MNKSFPFSAIIGQEAMQTALLLNAVDPSIGGVLIQGEKGTGKSTAARALAAFLPYIEVIKGCPFNSSPSVPGKMHPRYRNRFEKGESFPTLSIPVPFIELPLNATEDRVVGSLHIEKALQNAERVLEPGLLAAANRGILYVDEVNLLEDHIVDVLLDAAESGINRVEREGISEVHPARFMLIGTMNPEEGELRPQFLDRFALSIWACHIESPETRKEIARRVLDFETDPEAFRKRFELEEENLRAMVSSARKRLPATEVPAFCFDLAIDICARSKAAGHRADISLLKAARALAAFLESPVVSPQHIFEAARYVLSHRMARSPGEDHRQREGRLGKIIEQSASALITSEPDLDSGDDGKQGKEAKGEKEGEAAKAAGDDLRLSESETFAESEETGEVPGPAAAGSLMFEYIKKKAAKPL